MRTSVTRRGRRRSAAVAAFAVVVGACGVGVSGVGPAAATEPAPARTGAASAGTPDVDALVGAIEALVDDAVGEVTPGAVVALVTSDGPVLVEGYGVADPVSGAPMTATTRLPVASVSKVVTGLAALTLHHDGRLDLDADVVEATGIELVDERHPAVRGPVTSRHLLTHHAGLDEPLLVYPPAPDGAVTLERWLADHPPVLGHAPELGLHYSPLQGHALVGRAIERATGTSFDEAVTAAVFGPVGMTGATFDDVAPPATADAATLSMPDGDGGWRPTSWPTVPERPAATLQLTATDAAALLAALLGDGDGLDDEVRAEALTTAIRPAHGGGGHTQVLFEEPRHGIRVLEHAGGNGLAWLAVVPEAGIGVFAAVTTEAPEAASFAPSVVDEVAGWAAARRGPEADPWKPSDLGPVTPTWATAEHTSVAPVGTFHERLFSAREPEILLRSLTGEVRVTRDGDDLRLGDRTLRPDVAAGTSPPVRWCDADGCVAGLRDASGTTTLLRSDRAMLERTLTEAPWTQHQLPIAVIAGLTVVGGPALLVAWVRRERGHRRGDGPAPVTSRIGAAWGVTALAVTVGTPATLVAPLVGEPLGWVASDAWSLVALRIGAWTASVLAVALLVAVARTWRRRSVRRRVTAASACAAAGAAPLLLATWQLY